MSKTYTEMVEEFTKQNKALIEISKKDDTPNQVLFAKGACKEFHDDDKCFTFSADFEGFAFSERMVNKLMHLAFLMGSKDVDKDSFESGYNKARAEMATFLDLDDGDED
jgi:hypothetical protein